VLLVCIKRVIIVFVVQNDQDHTIFKNCFLLFVLYVCATVSYCRKHTDFTYQCLEIMCQRNTVP